MKINRSILLVSFLLMITSYASAQKFETQRTYINLPENEKSGLPFSDGVMTGNTLYISGTLGIDSKTMKIPDDPEKEATLLLEGFKSVLAKVDMTMDHLVYVTVYCPDLTLYDTFNKVYRSYFNTNFPARAFIGSGPLLLSARFEMQGIAVR